MQVMREIGSEAHRTAIRAWIAASQQDTTIRIAADDLAASEQRSFDAVDFINCMSYRR